MPIKTTKWDSADHLKTKEDIAAYLEAVFEYDDPILVVHALGDVARSKGLAQVAKNAGMSPESLRKALKAVDGSQLTTALKVIKVLGLVLLAKTAEA